MKSVKILKMTGLIVIIGITFLPLSAQHYEGQTTLGVYGSAMKLVGGDLDQDMISPLAGLRLGHTVVPGLTITLNGGYGWTYPMNWEKSGISKHIKKYSNTPFKTILIPATLNAQLNYRPGESLNPYLTWGLGVLVWDLQSDGNSVHDRVWNGLADFGVGMEVFLTYMLGLDASLHYQHILHQEKDMSGYGNVQTGNLEARVGLSVFMGGKKDRDSDGIYDKDDGCPDQPEDMDGFQDEDGCPDLDNDMDGIPDLKDQAPNQAEDMDGYQDEDGIPDLDNDNDGILDAQDGAPDQAEDMDSFQDEDGVPDLDNDGDGIEDKDDPCPNEPETVNGFQDDDGCPDKKPEIVLEKAAPIVLEGVTFKSGSSTLNAEAKKSLDKVVQTLTDYPEIALEVSGYTDNSGNRQSNINLSQRRADAVRQYFIDKGIDMNRIQSKGYGPEKPVAPNNTSEGRAKNRRIEFLRIK